MGPLAGDLKVLMELPQLGATMISKAEMPHRTSYNIISVERANVHPEDRLPVHVSPSGDLCMRECTINQER